MICFAWLFSLGGFKFAEKIHPRYMIVSNCFYKGELDADDEEVSERRTRLGVTDNEKSQDRFGENTGAQPLEMQPLV